MLQLSVLALVLCGGTLVEPFRIAQAELDHHQTYPCAAMTPDGHFALAWVDSIASGHPLDPEDLELELFVRFFDQDGNPMTDAYQIAKLADTNWIYWSCLEMDTAGNAILLWVDRETRSAEEPSYVRFQRFAPDGSPVGSAHTLVARVLLGSQGKRPSPIDLSLNNQSEFAVTWCEVETSPPFGLSYVWVQRFDLDGYPEDQAFLVHDVPGDAPLLFSFPRVTLNDAGDVAVTWRDESGSDTVYVYQRFQVFDAADEPILSWRPRGHLLDYEEGGSWAEPYWLDDDRFVAFWTYGGLMGGVFGHRGLTRYPIRLVVIDSLAGSWRWGGSGRKFSVAFSSDERFAETHQRVYHHQGGAWWDHGGGVLGEIRDNEPWRQTNLFEYTPPWGKDTTWKDFLYCATAVGACDDRIVWVYLRPNLDTISEAWAMITDWDMGVGVVEQPVSSVSPIKLEASINRLFYDVSGSVTGEAKLTFYSVDGRRILEETIKGKGTWTPSTPSSFPSGVYFARVTTEGHSIRTKVVVLR